MRIVLNKPMVLAVGLSLSQAKEALKKAAESSAAEHVTFYLESGPKCNGHELHGRPKFLTKIFLNDPESFLIEIQS